MSENGSDTPVPTPAPKPCESPEIVAHLQNLTLAFHAAAARTGDLSRDVCSHGMTPVHLARLSAILEEPRAELNAAIEAMQTGEKT